MSVFNKHTKNSGETDLTATEYLIFEGGLKSGKGQWLLKTAPEVQ
jgi:hypothetical protein